jgi:hypothetical protein
LHRVGHVTGARGQRAQQIAWSFGARQHRLRQTRAEALLEAGEQLDSCQTVETELALERAVETDWCRWTVRVQFGSQHAHRGEQVFGRGCSLGIGLRVWHCKFPRA